MMITKELFQKIPVEKLVVNGTVKVREYMALKYYNDKLSYGAKEYFLAMDNDRYKHWFGKKVTILAIMEYPNPKVHIKYNNETVYIHRELLDLEG